MISRKKCCYCNDDLIFIINLKWWYKEIVCIRMKKDCFLIKGIYYIVKNWLLKINFKFL